MVWSKALLFSWKKITFFYFYFFCYWICSDIRKNVEKSCDARFFGDKTVLRFFFGFQKKVEKIGKNAFFSEKSLWSQVHFYNKTHYHLSCKKNEKSRLKKMSKKKGFRFLKLFFKNENWTFIFVHFWN